jgi:hypothetical protein
MNDDPFSLSGYPFPLIGLDGLAGMVLAAIELRPELPRAFPITMKCEDSSYCLVGLRFETPAEAEHFANGLAEVVTKCDCDGRRLFLKSHPAINQDECGNCSGIN